MNLPSRDIIKQLAGKWLKNTITDQEKEVYVNWYNKDGQESHPWEDGSDLSDQELENRLLKAMNARLDKEGKSYRLIRIISAAALLILISTVAIILVSKQSSTSIESTARSVIKPGIKKATLTLSNGSTISLADFKKGTIKDQTGSRISRDSTGQLKYETAQAKTIANYTVSTPEGTEYQFRLPDGSDIWLNSGSSITYPNNFAPKHERRIELTGEAYFEIKKDKKSPFKVITKSQEIRVLGTHFNVNSYADQSFTKTTLLEGSVIVNPTLKDKTSSTVVLKPGEQLTLTEKSLKVEEADTTQAVGWKNGRFIFRQEDFKTALNRIAKWYNVSISYKNIKPIDFKPWASISRQNSLTSVLKMLESTDQVHFKIEGRTIIVTN
ncbi:FecR family protein [Pedobacter sp. L105]|uniref:FecR family protein n=1 Tax=Pedobacter sp. L105 TaxID=1641871 RepID=UPI00131AEBE2|nr:FecR family protein [Pedobacter sp. L105]